MYHRITKTTFQQNVAIIARIIAEEKRKKGETLEIVVDQLIGLFENYTLPESHIWQQIAIPARQTPSTAANR